MTEQIFALNKKHIETAFQAMQIVFDGIEALTRLNIKAASMLFQEGAASVNTLASVSEIDQFNQWNANQTRAGAGKVLGYSSNVYEITSNARREIGELLEQSLLQSGQDMRDWVEVGLKSSPIGQPEAAASATSSTMAHAQAMIDGISKAAKRAAGYADANVRAAATATAEAVNGAVR